MRWQRRWGRAELHVQHVQHVLHGFGLESGRAKPHAGPASVLSNACWASTFRPCLPARDRASVREMRADQYGIRTLLQVAVWFKPGACAAGSVWTLGAAGADQKASQSSVPVLAVATCVERGATCAAGVLAGLSLKAGRLTLVARWGPRRSRAAALAATGAK